MTRPVRLPNVMETWIPRGFLLGSMVESFESVSEHRLNVSRRDGGVVEQVLNHFLEPDHGAISP